MKPVFVLLVLILNLPGTFAQIVNGGFENWNGTEPEGWKTSNSEAATYVVKSTESHSGNYSLSSTVINNFGISYGGLLLSGQNGEGFAISERYAALTGFYKFVPADANDRINIIILAYVISDTDTTYIGSGMANLAESQNFTQFNVGIMYSTSSVPNHITISISFRSTSGIWPTAGSKYFIDDLALSTAVKANDFSGPDFTYKLNQNYPNPFNPVTSIKYSIKENTNVYLSVYDILGREIRSLVNENKNPGEYEVKFDAGGITSGIYFYRLKAGDFIQTKKMLILK